MNTAFYCPVLSCFKYLIFIFFLKVLYKAAIGALEEAKLGCPLQMLSVKRGNHRIANAIIAKITKFNMD
jgi:hypothetical protein